MESPDIIPTEISQEAWQAAMFLDEQIAQLFSRHGISLREGRSKITEAAALLVQLAINKSHARNDTDLRPPTQ
jgi:hypothetical protein